METMVLSSTLATMAVVVMTIVAAYGSSFSFSSVAADAVETAASKAPANKNGGIPPFFIYLFIFVFAIFINFIIKIFINIT